jgi:hypothetical protein
MALAASVEAVAAAVAAVGLWIGGRWASLGVVVLGLAMAASAATLVFVFGAPAVPGAVSRILVAAIGAGAFLWIFRREFGGGETRDRRTNRPLPSRDL